MLYKYVEKHASNSIKTAEKIENLLKFVREEDPNSLLMIFGDHGAWLSRGQKYKTTKNKTFFIQDRFAVLGGIYPATACRDSEEQTTSHLTLQMLAQKTYYMFI